MSLFANKTSYAGEVIEAILTQLMTGNELFEMGLIHIEPGVQYKLHIPRLKVGQLLQKRKENPTLDDSKGELDYSEVELEPRDAMVFTKFNPRDFERLWRKHQPTGELVFSELPPSVQITLLKEILKQATFEIGDHMINGVQGDGPTEFFNGILTRICSNNDVIRVKTAKTSMIDKLSAVHKAIPTTLRKHPKLTIVMSQEDFDAYDDELSALPSKAGDVTSVNVQRFKGIPIKVLTRMPQGVIFATVCSVDADSNLWAAVNLAEDFTALKVARWNEASEVFFVKMLLKVDTNIAFGGEVVLLDTRSASANPKTFISAKPAVVAFPVDGGSTTVKVVASGDYTFGGTYTGFSVEKVDKGVTITAERNDTTTDKSGTLELLLTGTDKKVVIEITQGNGK